MHILYTHIYTMLVITHDMLYYAIPQNSFSPWLHEDTLRGTTIRSYLHIRLTLLTTNNTLSPNI